IAGWVQSDPETDHRAVERDPDRGQLLVPPPDSGQARRRGLGVHAKAAQELDQRPLQELEVAGDGHLQAGQVDDRVADELARPVVRRLPATVRPHYLHVPARPLRLVPAQALRYGRLAPAARVRE